MPDQETTGYLSTRLPVEVLGVVEEMAERERRSLSFMARILIEEAVKARAKKSNKQ